MDSLGWAAVEVLTTADPIEKAAKSIIFTTQWRDGAFSAETLCPAPDYPARPDRPELLSPKEMPKRRKAGSDENRVALFHAIAHIELKAIDLAWDMVARFGAGMPKEFLDDWVSVGADEARHFTLLTERLEALGAKYGDLPAHDGLWQAAYDTRGDLLARLAVVPMVLEARGLDVTPGMIERFEKFGDHKSANVLETIYGEEIEHVKAGAKWFKFICKREGRDPETTYHALVRKYFKGKLKPPFNVKARSLAGLEKEFYLPLAEKN
jgi:uncharacterized ferritin-like protein (DUF455 family)